MPARFTFRRLRRPLRGLAAIAAAAAAMRRRWRHRRRRSRSPPPAWRAPTLQVAGAEQPVRMTSLRIDVEVAAGVAETRVQMVFLNPNSRILEGKLQFPLAAGQIVSGFALDVDGRMRAAVPVEKARAQQVFEDIARRRVDPGLLQTTLGNNYELRVYPLLPGKTRTVELRIVEPAAARLQVPLGVCRARRQLRADAARSGRGERARAGRRPGARAALRARGRRRLRRSRAQNDVALPGDPLVVRLPLARPPARRSRPSSATARATSRSSCRWRSAPRRACCRTACRSSGTLPGRRRIARPTASSRCSTPTSARRATPASTWSASPTRRRRRSLRGSRRRLERAPARAREHCLRRREQPRRGAPRRRLGRGALVQRRPGDLRRAVAARLPGAGVRDQQRGEQRPGGAAGARRRERRTQHRPRRDDAAVGRRRAAASRQSRSRASAPSARRRSWSSRRARRRAGSSSPAS